jgi:NAD kinase
MSSPRAVVVSRPTELEHLVARHGTREQARFALRARGQDLGEVEARHERFLRVMTAASQAIPSGWRRSRVARDDLCRFVWDPGDVVVVIGQDGLVANVAKYLAGQPVIGINPDPARIDGVLVAFGVEALEAPASRTTVKVWGMKVLLENLLASSPLDASKTAAS